MCTIARNLVVIFDWADGRRAAIARINEPVHKMNNRSAIASDRAAVNFCLERSQR
jgi:hypothetical protein